MSQQINLLGNRPHPQAVALASAAFLAAAVVVLGVTGLIRMRETASLRGEVAKAQQQLADTRAALAVAQAVRQGPNGPLALEAEVNQLRARSLALAPLMTSMQNGSAGNPAGFARNLLALSTLAQEDVWITAFEAGGKGIPGDTLIAGRAMSNEAAVRYARRANEAFKPLNVHFSAIELHTEGLTTSPAPGQAPPPPLPGAAFVTFKIS